MQNENSEILTELKKINKFNSSSKKLGIAFMILLFFGIGLDIFTKIQLKNEEKKYYQNKNKQFESRNEEKISLWRDINNKLYPDDIVGAIKVLKEAVDENPKNYYNQAELAEKYLRINNLEKALEHFKLAQSLLPLEKYEKLINVIEKRLENNS